MSTLITDEQILLEHDLPCGFFAVVACRIFVASHVEFEPNMRIDCGEVENQRENKFKRMQSVR